MNLIIANKKDKLISLCKSYKVKYLYSFGSVNTALFTAKSDIDFLIAFDDDLNIEEYTENYFSLQYQLRDLFKREIDLVTEKSLSNPYFIQGVEQTKRLIYAA